MHTVSFVYPEYVEKEKGGDKNHARFVIYPFVKGWAKTIGNSLRRALLSSIPGAAVIMVNIDGVDHEFSAIDGVYEDVVQIILNVKKLILKVTSDEPQKLIINASGKGEYKASHIKPNPYVEILNPDLHLFTITGTKTSLNMEMFVTKGWGYVPVEYLKIDDLMEPGSIPVDAFFSPVKKVNFYIDNMRYGDRMDYEKLIIEIWTNGAIIPEEALYIAGERLKTAFNNIITIDKDKEELKDIIFKLKYIDIDMDIDKLQIEDVDNLNILEEEEKEKVKNYLRRKNETQE